MENQAPIKTELEQGKRCVLELPKHFPSLSACLEQCIHFERKPVSGPAAQRGTRIHNYINYVLTGIMSYSQVPRSYQKPVAIAVDCAVKIGGQLLLAEEEIYAEIDECTRISCTPDFVLRSEIDYTITSINWKTGSERDYKLPQRFYTVALCQRYGVREITIIECYVDLGYAKSYTLDLDNSIERALDMLHKYASKASYAPTACEYCRWCEKGPTGDRSCDTGCAQIGRS